jgi:hypothetical protein
MRAMRDTAAIALLFRARGRGSNGRRLMNAEAAPHLPNEKTCGLSALISQYSIACATANGMLPWTVSESVATLTAALPRRDLRKASSAAADRWFEESFSRLDT